MHAGIVAVRLLALTLVITALLFVKASVLDDAGPFDCQPGTIDDEIPCVTDDGYNFTAGELVFEPYAGFCDDYRCAPEFAVGSGHVVQCADGLFSRDGGLHRACESHGGVGRALYER